MRISVKSEQYEIVYELNGSTVARELYAQLPLTAQVEPFSNNEMTFYPERLNVEDAPLRRGARLPVLLQALGGCGDVLRPLRPQQQPVRAGQGGLRGGVY